MRANLGQIYDETVTVINKLDARDGGLKQDSYHVTVLEHCMWSTKATRTVGSDGTVSVGTTQVVQIPEDANYKPYKDWKSAPNGYFTVRTGDYVVRGEVTEEITDETTAAMLRKIIAQYEPDAFQVQLFRNATKGDGFTHSTSGVMRFVEAYILEG